MFRLILAGYVARKYLLYDYEDSWCGFIIGGKTAGFKTRTLILVIRVLRLKPESKYIRRLTTTLPKELLGRRGSKEGGGMTINLSECIDLPLLGLDEYQKGDSELKRLVLFFLDGTRDTHIEDKDVMLRPCPIVTMNLNLKDELDLPPEVVRRSCVVNTRDLGIRPQAYEEASDKIFNSPIPGISTDNLKITFHTLEPDERALVRKILYDCTGRFSDKDAVFDSQAVNILVTGWLALTGGKNVEDAVFDVCFDRLMCLSTLGLVEPGWYDTWLDLYAKHKGEVSPDFEKKRLEIEKRKEEIKVTIEKGKERVKEIQKTKEEIRKDLVRAYSRVNTDYKILIKDLNEAKKFIPEIETGGLLGYIRDDRDQFKSGKKTEDRLERYQRVFNEDKEASDPYLGKAKQKGIDIELEKKSKKEEKERVKANDREARREAIQGMRDLRSDCIRQNQWRAAQTAISYANQRRARLPKKKNVVTIVMDPAKGQAENMITAITKLREVTKRVCSKLTTRINTPGGYSTPELEHDLESLTVEANPWIEEFKKATREPFDKITDYLSKGGKGDSVAREKPPTKPKNIGYGGRSEDDLPEKGGLPSERIDLKGKDSEELLKSFGYGASESEQPREGLDKNLRKKRIVLAVLLIAVLVLVIVYFVFLRRPLETDTA